VRSNSWAKISIGQKVRWQKVFCELLPLSSSSEHNNNNNSSIREWGICRYLLNLFFTWSAFACLRSLTLQFYITHTLLHKFTSSTTQLSWLSPPRGLLSARLRLRPPTFAPTCSWVKVKVDQLIRVSAWLVDWLLNQLIES
jgi:hypothetical protein